MAALLLRLLCRLVPAVHWGFVFVDDFCWILRQSRAPRHTTMLLALFFALGAPFLALCNIRSGAGARMVMLTLGGGGFPILQRPPKTKYFGFSGPLVRPWPFSDPSPRDVQNPDPHFSCLGAQRFRFAGVTIGTAHRQPAFLTPIVFLLFYQNGIHFCASHRQLDLNQWAELTRPHPKGFSPGLHLDFSGCLKNFFLLPAILAPWNHILSFHPCP